MRGLLLIAFAAAAAGCGPSTSAPQETVPTFEEKPPNVPADANPNALKVKAS